MDELTLRPATRADGAFLFDLLKAALGPYVAQTWGWDEGWQRTYFWSRFAPETAQVVVLGGRDVGVLAVEEDENVVTLSQIYLLPEVQGQGIGTALIRTVLERAFVRALPVRLRVLRVNPARRLYERLGFGVIDETETHCVMQATPPALSAFAHHPNR
ncbi:MAG: GNAT family N-acetyltransferase [Anaerolineae bacterium]|nr:GNAT family N-acetyltransferase [Anaerolineae bacterium]